MIFSFSKKFRIELLDNRNEDTIKSFINRYIEKGNIIVSDGW